MPWKSWLLSFYLLSCCFDHGTFKRCFQERLPAFTGSCTGVGDVLADRAYPVGGDYLTDSIRNVGRWDRLFAVHSRNRCHSVGNNRFGCAC